MATRQEWTQRRKEKRAWYTVPSGQREEEEEEAGVRRLTASQPASQHQSQSQGQLGNTIVNEGKKGDLPWRMHATSIASLAMKTERFLRNEKAFKSDEHGDPQNVERAKF